MLLIMEGQQEEEKEQDRGEKPETEVEGDAGGEISMHALQGHASGRILKVRGIAGK